MSDRLGICVRYRRRPSTEFTLRLAECLKQRGTDIQFYSYTSPGEMQSSFDRDVRWREPWDVWARRWPIQLWDEPPSIPQLNLVRGSGGRISVLADWHHLYTQDIELLRHTRLLCSSQSIFQAMIAKSLDDVICLDIDPGLPIRTPPVRTGPLTVLWPAWDGLPTLMERTTLTVLQRALEQVPGWRLLVGYTASGLSSAVWQSLRHLQRTYPLRVELRPAGNVVQRPALFWEADITFYPVRADSLCWVPRQSISQGVPVFAFNIPPLTDWLGAGNSVLVSTPIERTDMAAPVAVQDNTELDEVFYLTVRDPDYVRQLQLTTNDGLLERRKFLEYNLNCWRSKHESN